MIGNYKIMSRFSNKQEKMKLIASNIRMVDLYTLENTFRKAYQIFEVCNKKRFLDSESVFS